MCSQKSQVSIHPNTKKHHFPVNCRHCNPSKMFLPPEILDRIFNLCRRKDARLHLRTYLHLCSVNKSWNEQATRYLYENVILYGPKKGIMFLRTIAKKMHYRHCIRRFCVMEDLEKSGRWKADERTSHRLLSLISALPHLNYLSSNVCPNMFSETAKMSKQRINVCLDSKTSSFLIWNTSIFERFFTEFSDEICSVRDVSYNNKGSKSLFADCFLENKIHLNANMNGASTFVTSRPSDTHYVHEDAIILKVNECSRKQVLPSFYNNKDERVIYFDFGDQHPSVQVDTKYAGGGTMVIRCNFFYGTDKDEVVAYFNAGLYGNFIKVVLKDRYKRDVYYRT